MPLFNYRNNTMNQLVLQRLQFMLVCMAFFAPLHFAQAGTLPQTIQQVKRSVVAVGTYQLLRSPRAEFRGTGYAVGDGLHVVTNHHVVSKLVDVQRNEMLGIFTGSGETAQFRRAQIAVSDALHDVVLLKFAGAPLPVLEIGDSDAVQEGWELYFTGYPIGTVLGLYPSSIRAGIASITPIVRPAPNTRYLDARSVRRAGNPFNVFQIDGISYPGNSGSPLYDPQTGIVYGTVNSTFVKSTKENVLKDPSAISYAIPSRYVKALLKQAGLESE